MSQPRNVVIIGSGPAGLTAAIYAARAALKPLVFEGSQPGGQLMITNEVENYPGFPEGVMGPEMMDMFRQQAQRFDAETKFQHVSKVDFSSRPFQIWVEDELTQAETVIISTGATARLLGLENESKLMGHGVSACATCDGFFYKDREVVVVGGGDSAMEEANFLTKFASKVTLVHRRDEFRASKIMQDRILNNPKVDVRWNTLITDMLGDPANGGLKAVEFTDVNSGKVENFPTDGAFMAIGHKPNTELFKGQLELDPKGYIITEGNSSRTSIPGVFACGDVQDSTYRQAVTAAGSGCKAALDAEKFLEETKH
ncbi:thioredoxin-disulfide reductase [Candidatus Neomarinimicrobiota bacterium]